MSQRGHCTGFYGPMFAGKSSRMLQMLNRVKHAPFSNRTCVVRYVKDERYSDEHVVTHDGMKMESIGAMKLNDILSKLKEYDNIGIDEAQFFTDAYMVINKLVNKYHKRVVFSALDTNYKGEPFGDVANLICLCDHVEKLTSVCKACGNENGIYSFLDESYVPQEDTPSKDGRIEVIGGDEKFYTVCRTCFHAKKPRLTMSQ